MAWIQLATWRYLGAVGMGQNEETGEWYAISALNSGGYDDLTYNTDEEATWADSKWRHLIKFALEYDSESLTATSIKLRIRTLDTSTSAWDTDYYYAYVGPQSDSKGTVVKVKDHGDTGTSAFGQPTGDTFTITKARTATYFTIPTIWLMHTGGVAVVTTSGVHTLTYDSTVNVYSLFNSGNRKNFKTIIPGFNQSSKSGTITIPVILDNSAGDPITITDNGNNTATINIPSFKVGSGNAITNTMGQIIFYDSNGEKKGDTISANTTGTHKVNIPANATSVSVSFTGTNKYPAATYTEKTKTGTVKYYQVSSISNLCYYSGTVEDINKNKVKPRVKDTLTWSWTGLAGNNATIKGYRVVFYKGSIDDSTSKYNSSLEVIENTENTGTSLPIPKSKLTASGTVTSGRYTKDNDDYHYFDIATTASSGTISINPKDVGFNKKDSCHFAVAVIAKWGDSADHIGTWKSTKSGGECTFANGANMWIKTSTEGWKEAESVWIKTSTGTWKEADSIWIKTKAEGWKESS